MKRGPKPRQITKELLKQIEHHAARGLSQKQICDALGFSETWWHAKPTNSSQSDTLQLKSLHSCKTNRLVLYIGFS